MAYESELEAELEDEFEAELEDEAEDELEAEDFLGGLLGEGEDFLGSILGEGEEEDFLGSILGEGEDEFESENEFEDEISPIRKIYPDAVMEHLGELAAESESEDEAAEHFLPLIGMAASKLLPVVAKAIAPKAKRALPKIAKVLTKATPSLTRGIGKVAKVLHRNPHTRHLLRVVPGIARRTVGTIAHRAARGGHITPHVAVRTLAKQARRVLGTPHHRAQALRRHHHLERRFHTRVGRGIARPHVHYGRHYGRGSRLRGGVAPRMSRTGLRAMGARGVGARPVAYGRAAGAHAVSGHALHCGCCCCER
jgi:hypothetical protein